MRPPVHHELLSHEDVRQFTAVAQEFCQLVETVDRSPKVYFLERLDELLPLLYSLAHRLPDPFNWDEDDEDSEWEPGPEGLSGAEHLSLWTDWRERIGKKIDTHCWFHFVYDPVDPADQKIVDAHLGDVIADIYLALKDGLILYERPTDNEKAQAIWNWRFGMTSIWGRHALEALLPIHCLLHHHYDEDDEVFDL